MKILISAYASNPFGGSEPGVGWTAVCRIAREHEVCVLTDIHNKSGWDEGSRTGVIPENVRVRFLRDHSACSQNRFVAHLQSWLNYRSFNQHVLEAARQWHAEERFDLCHQVTIAGWRMPSPLWQLPIPFVWGPIGGAGYIPPAFRPMLSTQARIFERARDFNSWWASRSSAFRDCIRETAVVFAANEETDEFLSPFRGGKPMIRLPIASFPEEKVLQLRRPVATRKPGPMRLFAGGNMEGRKGGSIALQSLALLKQRGIPFQYTVAGGGPDVPALESLCAKLGLTDQVDFVPSFQKEQYLEALHQSDVYFLPSFRESTPVTLLEAMLAGCHPVVADTSAQGEIVRLAGGTAVPVHSIEQLVTDLAAALESCAQGLESLFEHACTATAVVAETFSSARYDATLKSAYAVALGSRA
jgi:glycosyltransferase involved in cell wall biosynthesis